MLTTKDLEPTLAVLEGIVNGCVHPNEAVRALLVDLKPIRAEINRLKDIKKRLDGPVIADNISPDDRT